MLLQCKDRLVQLTPRRRAATALFSLCALLPCTRPFHPELPTLAALPAGLLPPAASCSAAAAAAFGTPWQPAMWLGTDILMGMRQPIGTCGHVQVIAIDEAQFFGDLVEFCAAAADEEAKHLIVAGLDGDFQRRRFGQVRGSGAGLPLSRVRGCGAGAAAEQSMRLWGGGCRREGCSRTHRMP